MNDKMLLAELKSIETRMDFIDCMRGDYWDKGQLCFWCGSRRYDGTVGVIHDMNCPKFQVRVKITMIENGKSTTK